MQIQTPPTAPSRKIPVVIHFALIFNIMATFLLSGCAAPSLSRRQPDITHEREYLGGRDPEVGLALSGGGTRSASYSIGVLNALSEMGAMEKIDVISSVSGGSYASYWYFTQNSYFNRRPSDPSGPTRITAFRDSETGEWLEPPLPRLVIDPKYLRLKDENCQQQEQHDQGTEACDICDSFQESDLFQTAQDNLLGGTVSRAQTSISKPYNYRFQHTLEQSSNIMNYSKSTMFKRALGNSLQYTANIASFLVMMPIHWVVNGVFDGEANLNPYRQYYQNGLERTYGFAPLDYDLNTFANDQAYLGFKHTKAYGASFGEMRKYLEVQRTNGRKLPYFIVNSTASRGRIIGRYDENKKDANGEEQGKLMANAIFEFTPWQCGSGLFGYHDIDSFPGGISLPKAVSISGAAIDGQTETVDIGGRGDGERVDLLSTFLDFLNADLGYHVRNPSTHPLVWYFSRFIPFPIKYVTDGTTGGRTSGIHLSDGGHAENLAVYSLVRRGVKKIIVVDAESDPKSTFNSAKRLAHALEKEMGLKLVFGEQAGGIDVYDTPIGRAVIKGRITGNLNNQDVDIELRYVKLSLDRSLLQPLDNSHNKYPTSVTLYKQEEPAFPHHSTADIFYRAEQYRAYRDLGYFTVAKQKDDLREFLGLGN